MGHMIVTASKEDKMLECVSALMYRFSCGTMPARAFLGDVAKHSAVVENHFAYVDDADCVAVRGSLLWTMRQAVNGTAPTAYLVAVIMACCPVFAKAMGASEERVRDIAMEGPWMPEEVVAAEEGTKPWRTPIDFGV